MAAPRIPLAVLLLCVLTLAACTEQPVAPTNEPPQRSFQTWNCTAGCTLVSSAAPLAAAVENPDSAGATLQLARVVITGRAGQRVALRLTVDDTVVAAAGPRVALLIRGAEGKVQRVALRTLRDPVSVYHFRSDQTITLTLALESRVEHFAAGRFELSLTSAATVEVMMAPWGRAAPADVSSLLSFSVAGTGCTLTTATGPVAP